jgi:AcrR family transcriptional regulator
MDPRQARSRRGKAATGSVASTRIGTETATRIVETARKVLMDKGYAQFSMRNVAAAAGMHLNNVQYYFGTRDGLVRALMRDIEVRYGAAYERCLATASPDRLARFKAVLKFNLEDTGKAETRRFFTQIWALLDTLEGDSGRMLDQLYEMDLAVLCRQISELDPRCPAKDVRRRATLLASMIEGLIVVHGAHSSSAAEAKRLIARAQALGIHIALGRFESRTK